MSAAPDKTAIEEANRQLNGMFQQMVEQERQFKTELHEKEQEIVRLHTLHQQTEERLMGRLAVAQAEAERMAAALAAKEHATVNLEDAFVEITAIVKRVGLGGHTEVGNGAASMQLATNSLITPSKLVKLPSGENHGFTIDE
eukprot:m.418586 g.418586  ORF g.418586 m.418586 type:complete len:142 (-) comp31012_c0_seq1:282-707(-)